MEKKLKHLEMIQGIVNRLAHTSFLLKGWSIVLVSALLAACAKEMPKPLILLAYLPALCFWGLDGYYLMLERLFRRLYDDVRVLDPDAIDFSMCTPLPAKPSITWIKAVFSKTLIAYHGVLVLSITIIWCLLRKL